MSGHMDNVWILSIRYFEPCIYMKDVEPLVPATKSCICFAPLGAHQHDVHIAKGILGVLQHEGLTSWPVETRDSS